MLSFPVTFCEYNHQNFHCLEQFVHMKIIEICNIEIVLLRIYK